MVMQIKLFVVVDSVEMNKMFFVHWFISPLRLVYLRKLASARLDFVSRLHEDTLHVDIIHVRFKIANITHTQPVPVNLQTYFTPKRVVVSRLHDIVEKFGTRVKFSLRYNNRGELTPG